MRYFALILILLVICGCTPPDPMTLEEPLSNDAMLIIGSVLVEDDYYTEIPGVHYEDIEVAILAEIIEDGKLKKKGFWAKTDENGYFYLINMPRGQYALTGVRVYLNDQSLLVITNSLLTQDSEFEIAQSDHISFSGNYFDIPPEKRVVNLQTNYFSVDTQSRGYRDLKYFRRNSIRGLRLVDGIKLETLPPDKYFQALFAGTSWADILKNN